MRASTLASVIALVATIVVASPRSAYALTNCDTDTAWLSSSEIQMLDLTNEIRVEHGLHPLTISPNLSRAGAWKSADSSASGPGFSHTDSLGRGTTGDTNNRARDCGYPDQAAENIAYGYASVQATMDAWMQSAGHRANILSPHYVVMGVGQVGKNWTMNFGLVDDSGDPWEVPPGAATPEPTQAGQPPQSTPTATPEPTQAADTPTAQPSPTATLTPEPQWRAQTSLSRGLNVITFAAGTTDAQAALATIAHQVEWVYAWDAQDEAWLRLVPGAPEYLTSLEFFEWGKQYLVWVNTPITWRY